MDEYINREKTKRELSEWCISLNSPHLLSRDDTMFLLDNIPAADVAPVVRCKDCKHHYDCGVHFCDRLGMDCPDDSDFFCSYGERKDGGNENDR